MTSIVNDKRKQFLPYSEAARIVRAAGITTSAHYSLWYKTVKGLPSYPHTIYKDEWTNWSVFLTRTHN